MVQKTRPIKDIYADPKSVEKLPTTSAKAQPAKLREKAKRKQDYNASSEEASLLESNKERSAVVRPTKEEASPPDSNKRRSMVVRPLPRSSKERSLKAVYEDPKSDVAPAKPAMPAKLREKQQRKQDNATEVDEEPVVYFRYVIVSARAPESEMDTVRLEPLKRSSADDKKKRSDKKTRDSSKKSV